MEKRKCSMCKGTGKIDEIVKDIIPEKGIKCPACDGTGYLLEGK